MFTTNHIKNLKPYKVSSHEAWEFENKSDVLKLDWNEATIPPSPLVNKRLEEAFQTEQLNWYPDTNNQRLIKLLADYNKVKEENVQYFASSDSLHEYIVRCFITTTDRVLVLGPTYDNFRAVAESNGAMIQNYEMDNSFIPNIDQLDNDLNLIQPKVFYIVNPNNPTGGLISKEAITRLLLNHKKTLFVIDEAYFEFSGITMSNKVEEYDNLIITRTFSKAFALASFRLGYAIANKENIELLNKLRNPKNVSLYAQIAGIAVLTDIDYTKAYVKEVNSTKTSFFQSLLEFSWLRPINSKGNFIFIRINELNIKEQLLQFLPKKKIFIRDYGHIELTKHYVRITVGRKNQMEIVLKELNNFNALLKNKGR